MLPLLVLPRALSTREVIDSAVLMLGQHFFTARHRYRGCLELSTYMLPVW